MVAAAVALSISVALTLYYWPVDVDVKPDVIEIRTLFYKTVIRNFTVVDVLESLQGKLSSCTGLRIPGYMYNAECDTPYGRALFVMLPQTDMWLVVRSGGRTYIVGCQRRYRQVCEALRPP